MGRNRNYFVVPLVLFVVLLAVRLFFAFQTPFLDGASYQHLVKAGEIVHKGVFANPVFYYLLSVVLFFSKNVFVVKVFSNLFFVLVNVMVYFIALRLSKSRLFSAISALISGLLPVYFSNTFNLVSPLSLGLFLFFFNIFAYLNSEKKGWVNVYIISFIIFSFTHWLVILYVLGLAVYHLITRLEGIRKKGVELELSFFSVFFGLWAQVLVSKGLLFSLGLRLFSFNIPGVLWSSYFPAYSLPEVMSLLGVVPFFTGLYVIYKYSFERRGKGISFITSFILVAAALFFFRLLLVNLALIVLGLLFCVFLARWFSDFKVFARRAKVAGFLNVLVVFIVLIALLVVPVSVYFSFSRLKDSSQYEDIFDAVEWIKANTPEDAVILALPQEGSFVSYFSGRDVVITDDFLKFQDIDERLDDVYRIYKTRFETEAIGLLDKYDVSYILFSDAAKKKFGMDSLSYAVGKCLNVVHGDGGLVYFKDPGCKLRVIR